VVPRFLHQALSGGSIVLYGGGSQTRDFVHVSDVVAALVTAATARNINREVINIGSGVETSVAALVDAIEGVVGKRVNRIVNPEKAGGVARLVADIGKARRLLGFVPLVSLSEGLARMVREDARFQARGKKKAG
jgi:UDP-glucose 4-epimerase